MERTRDPNFWREHWLKAIRKWPVCSIPGCIAYASIAVRRKRFNVGGEQISERAVVCDKHRTYGDYDCDIIPAWGPYCSLPRGRAMED